MDIPKDSWHDNLKLALRAFAGDKIAALNTTSNNPLNGSVLHHLVYGTHPDLCDQLARGKSGIYSDMWKEERVFFLWKLLQRLETAKVGLIPVLKTMEEGNGISVDVLGRPGDDDDIVQRDDDCLMKRLTKFKLLIKHGYDEQFLVHRKTRLQTFCILLAHVKAQPFGLRPGNPIWCSKGNPIWCSQSSKVKAETIKHHTFSVFGPKGKPQLFSSANYPWFRINILVHHVAHDSFLPM